MRVQDSVIFKQHQDAAEAISRYETANLRRAVSTSTAIVMLVVATRFFWVGSSGYGWIAFWILVAAVVLSISETPSRSIQYMEMRIDALARALGLSIEDILSRTTTGPISTAGRHAMINMAIKLLMVEEYNRLASRLLDDIAMPDDIIEETNSQLKNNERELENRMDSLNGLLLEFKLIDESPSYKVWAYDEARKRRQR